MRKVRAQADARPKAIWIDTDIIFNKVAEDVDDGLALMLALNSERVNVAGIGLQRGVNNGYQVTQKMLGYYARYPIPVYKGADDIYAPYGSETEAVSALAAALGKQPLTIVAIGTATNIATLLELYPESAQNIKEIIFCAGRQRNVVFTARGSDVGLPDANFDNNPEALLKVLDSGLTVTLVGFEAASSIYLHWEDLRRIYANGRPGDKWVYRRLLYWLMLWKAGLHVDGFIPFDACTLGHVTHPEFLSYHRQIPIAVNTRANDATNWSKKKKIKPYLEVAYDFDSPYKVDFAYALNPEFKTKLMQELLGT